MSTNDCVRIAFCITDLDAGGAERALVQLVTRLSRDEWEPHVFCLSGPGELVAPLEAAGIPVECFGARGSSNLSVVWRLSRRLAKLKPALLQTFLFHANIAGRLAAKAAGVRPVVCGIRVAEHRSRWPLRIDRATDWMVDHHVCVSEGVAQFSAEKGGLPKEKLSVIPNGVDAEFFAKATPADLAQFGIPSGSETVLFVGRLDEQKAPEVLLAAAAQLINKHERLHFLFVGDGPMRPQLESTAAHGSLQNRVHFAGRRSDVASIMKGATCLVLPSRWEGMPNVVLEAMAAGLPVLATRVEGTSELITDGETGMLVSPQSSEELATRLSALLSDSAQRQAFTTSAQSLVAKQFAWDAVVADYARLYRRLLQK